MKTSNNKILITGGSAGIGLELAKQLSAGNKVIITGRNKERLDKAVVQLGGNVTGIVGDVSDEKDVDKLVETLYKEHPDLNVVINNAGAAYGPYSLGDPKAGAFKKAEAEMLTNYLSIIRLNEKLLDLLSARQSSAIVTVTSIVSIVPSVALPTYSASKAALHFYTEALRYQLKDGPIKVYELRPPLVATEFSSGIGGLENGIPASQVAEDLIKGLAEDRYDIHVGMTADLYKLNQASPEQAFLTLNGGR